MNQSTPKRRGAGIAAFAAALLITASLAPAAGFPSVHAQDRPPCSDGPGNAWDQVRGEIIGTFWPDGLPNPFEPESIDEVADRCLNLGFPPGDGVVPGLPGGPGTNRGDPHIVTQDGVAYDFHGAGDFVLLRSPANDVEMQVRYRRSKFVSLFAGVAIRTGDTTLTVENFVRGEDPLVTVDGEALTLTDLGWYDLDIGFVMRTGPSIYVELTNGVRFEARRAGLTLLTPAEWAGEFVGIQGNGDGDLTNDLATADGTPVDAADTEALYGAFFDGWYVEPADSYFTIAFDEVADGPIRPEEIVTLADLDPSDVVAAHEICVEAGLTAGFGLDDCVYDVAVTDDPFWAEDVAGISIASVPAVGLTPTVEQEITLGANDRVGPDIPAAGAGRIEQRYGADDFVLDAGGDDVRLLQVAEPCAEGPRPVAMVIVGERPLRSLPLACGSTHQLPSEAITLRVIDPTGGLPTYGFTVAPADRTDLGVLELGREYAGALERGARAVGELPLDSGDALFITALDGADCGPLIRIVDGVGDLQHGQRGGCIDVGPVVLDGAPPFSLEVFGANPGAYDFVVSQVADDSVTTATVGRSVDLVVLTPGQLANATIELEAGDRIYIETIDNIDGDLVITAPDGTELATTFSFRDLGLITATTTGTHTITLQPDDATTGTQQITIHDVADDTTVAASIGADIALRIITPGQLASATIELEAGDRIYIETIDNIDGDLVITAPDGTELATAFSFRDLGLITATTTGTHTITLQPDDATTGTQVVSIDRR